MLSISPAGYQDAAVQALVAQVQDEYVERYGNPDSSPLRAEGFDPPGGAFFLGRLAGAPVAMGGWRRQPDLDDTGRLGGRCTAEVRRMYVAPTARRRGAAREMLAHLELTAAAAGVDVLLLETGTEQPEAIALYHSSGYVPVAAFGHYAHSPKSRCLGRRLV